MNSRASSCKKRTRAGADDVAEQAKDRKDPASLKRVAVDEPMKAVKAKPPLATGAAKEHEKYYTKQPEDIQKLTRLLRPIQFVHDDPAQRPGLFIANTGLLGNQLGAYAAEDIIVGRSARRLLGYYAGAYSDELPESQDIAHYIFEHDEGGVIDAANVRNWAAYINHSEVNNVIAVSKVKDGVKQIWIYAVNDILANQPLYINYGPDYFCNMDFEPVYLGRHDNWEAPVDVWQRNPGQYCQQAFQFNDSTRQALGLLSAGSYVVPKLFKAVFDRDLDSVNAMLNDPTCAVELTVLAIDKITKTIAAADQQEKVTAFMLACHLGDPAIIARFTEYYEKYMAKKEDFTLFSDRSWRSGKTPLMYLLSGVADKKTKQELFAKFISLKKRLERVRFDLKPYFVLIDHEYQSLLGYCIRYELHDAAKLLLANDSIKEDMYAVMKQHRCHANIDTCVEKGDLIMLDIILKHSPNRGQVKKDIDSNYINLRKFSPEQLKKAKPTLDKYLKLTNLSKFAGGIFNPRAVRETEGDQPVVASRKRI